MIAFTFKQCDTNKIFSLFYYLEKKHLYNRIVPKSLTQKNIEKKI